jgi:uncharacterized membrane protein
MSFTWRTPRNQFISALAISSLASVAFYAYGAITNHSLEYGFFIWNLALAWMPFLFAIWLTAVLRRKLWSSWEGIAASVLWILFLPNSFYIISDLIHLREVPRNDILFDAVMYMSFIITGMILGFASLYLIQVQLRKRLTHRAAGLWVGAILLLCSIGIYIGRDLRWNSWDILTNPGGLLFDLSDRVLHPVIYGQMFVTIISFFVLLCSTYWLLWTAAKVLRGDD